jgi:hypothetical protein
MKVILLTLCLLSYSSASVWSTTEPISDPKDWEGVMNMDPDGGMESGSCVATLITPYHAITAAHCFTEGKWKSFPVQVDPAGNKRTVDKVYQNTCFIHADGGGPNSADIAVIRFSEKVTTVDPYPIYLFGDEVGKEFKIIGWGVAGKVGMD